MKFRKSRFFEKAGYIPHDKQKEVHESDVRFRVVAAGARAGKSMLAGAEIAYELTKPSKRIWCVASQYELADKEFDWALQFLSKVELLRGERIIDHAKIVSPSKGSRCIKLPWGSFCQTKSAEKPQGLLGEELDLIVLGEASQMPREPWQRMLRARLGPRRGKLLATSTPNTDAGLFMDLWKKGQDETEKDWQSWQFSTLDNPTFDKAEWDLAKQELDEKIFEEQYEGKFVSRRGSVFNIKLENIFDKIKKDMESWSIVIGIQKGYTNPFVVVFVAINPEDRSYWILDSIHQKEKLTQDIVPLMIELQKGRRIIATIVDYYDYQLQDELKRNGISTAWNNEKKYSKKFAQIRRVQCVQNILKRGDLHFYSGCKEIIEEIRAVKWHDPQREEKERAEIELPLTKYLQSTLAISYVLAFCEQARGRSIYEYGAKI